MNDNINNVESQPVKLKRLKPRDKLFVKKIVREGKTASLAYRETRGTTNIKTSHANSSKLLSKTSVQLEIAKQLDEAGLSSQYTDQSMQVLLDNAVNNARFIKPEAGVAIIRMVNELRDRFPASKSIQATVNVDSVNPDTVTLSQLKEQMEQLQENNRMILNKLESSSS